MAEPAGLRAWAEKRRSFIELTDERIISFPASRFRLLKDAPEEELAKLVLRSNGRALRWVDPGEDITMKGIISR